MPGPALPQAIVVLDSKRYDPSSRPNTRRAPDDKPDARGHHCGMSFQVRIETLVNPMRYTEEQLELAARIAEWLGRGRLVLCEEPND